MTAITVFRFQPPFPGGPTRATIDDADLSAWQADGWIASTADITTLPQKLKAFWTDGTVTISWLAPTVGTPESYLVTAFGKTVLLPATTLSYAVPGVDFDSGLSVSVAAVNALTGTGTAVSVEVQKPPFPVYTWAQLPLPQSYPLYSPVFISDIGRGAIAYSNGTTWLPLGGAFQLLQSAVPRGLAGYTSGTMGNDGALSTITALPLTYSTGIYLYFVADAIYTGSAAGFYWTVMSSTTAGTIYNNTWTPGTLCEVPGTAVPFSCTGVGTMPTYTTAEITLSSVNVPGRILGNNGVIRHVACMENNNSGNNKTWRGRYGGSSGQYISNVRTTTVKDFIFVNLQNRSASKQFVAGSIPSISSSSLGVSYAIDSTSDQALTISCQLAAATDCAVLEQNFVEVIPG